MNSKFTDQTIAQIAKCLQVAILTGTDIVDHLRQIQFVVQDGNIEISPEYSSQFETNLQKMLVELQEQQSSKKQTLFD
tara:strand:+ start:1669 stop:1902 length:234 start_codon:yes stop_codon:yes gene_type:complete